MYGPGAVASAPAGPAFVAPQLRSCAGPGRTGSDKTNYMLIYQNVL